MALMERLCLEEVKHAEQPLGALLRETIKAMAHLGALADQGGEK